ncbi:MAG: DUF2752 domain-containing protein [Clostridiales bacterium]|nr:DUF2752 domain-containing protein [Clostridiales bacterium]
MNLNSKIKSIIKEPSGWLYRLKIAIMIVGIYLILNIFGMGCPIRYITGITCPGCGMTRAILSALRLDFSSALYFHPLFFLVPFMFLIYLFGYKLKIQYVKVFWTAITIIFFGTYLFRLFYTQSDIVLIDLNNGFVLKFIHNYILGG